MTPSLTVAIDGGGVAAACAAEILTRAGMAVVHSGNEAERVPAIMLSATACAIVRDCLGRDDLFVQNARITRRVVAWGGQEPVALPHDAVMLGRRDFDFLLAPKTSPSDTVDFSIRAGRQPVDLPMMRFAERSGEALHVRLLQAEDHDRCWMESVEDGWLFMIPAGSDEAWLLAVGGTAQALLEQSRHLAPRLHWDSVMAVRFDTSPRLLDSITGPGWLACGTGAMAFDPICGDGTALAARQAILAAAIVIAKAEGEDAGQLLDHYQAMMIAAMRRHLRLCSEFYASGGSSPWWRAQQQALADGFAMLSARLDRQPPPRFALENFRLVRRELAA